MSTIKMTPPAITIEKGIPIPDCEYQGTKWTSFFDKLIPGDSFVVEDAAERRRIIQASKRYGVMLTSTKVMHGRQPCYRIWRIASQVERFRKPREIKIERGIQTGATRLEETV